MLQTAVEAAEKAGRLLLERYPLERKIVLKGHRDPVTDADTDAETLIVEMIRSRFPDHGVISEEAGGDGIADGYTWVVDPLDGTTNYIHHHPVFAVSIGVLEGGEPLIGVIHDPLRNNTFEAQRGAGARLNSEAVHVSPVSNLGHTLIGLDVGHTSEARNETLLHMDRLFPHCGTVRAMGSATLGLAYVAGGWIDGYFQTGMKPWDVAAGILMVREAGGRCTTLEGEPYQVDCPGCLSTNRLIHDELLKVLQGKEGSQTQPPQKGET